MKSVFVRITKLIASNFYFWNDSFVVILAAVVKIFASETNIKAKPQSQKQDSIQQIWIKPKQRIGGVAGPMGRPAPAGSHFGGPKHRDQDLPRLGNRPQNARTG